MNKHLLSIVSPILESGKQMRRKLQQNIKNLKRPAIQWPTIQIPRIHLPRFQRPAFTFPRPKRIVLPQIRFPQITLPKLNLKRPRLPRIQFNKVISIFSSKEFANLTIIFTFVFCVLSTLIIATQNHTQTAIAKDYVPDEPQQIISAADTLNKLEPTTGNQSQKEDRPSFRYPIEEDSLSVEAVLVPRRTTVISSSYDGRINEITVQNGDTFKKGDVLLRYDCDDLEAQANIAKTEKNITTQKAEGAYKLFKLDLISDLDRMTIAGEDKKASLKEQIYDAQLENCIIKAAFNGRVTNRLANPGEYTRTDRVLLEVASAEPLQAEFLIPSLWLRWINVGAPLTLTINETGATYDAELTRIYGEVDPISQSIQVVAQLKEYEDFLLPGMSGEAIINLEHVRSAGVLGFLETQQP